MRRGPHLLKKCLHFESRQTFGDKLMAAPFGAAILLFSPGVWLFSATDGERLRAAGCIRFKRWHPCHFPTSCTERRRIRGASQSHVQ